MVLVRWKASIDNHRSPLVQSPFVTRQSSMRHDARLENFISVMKIRNETIRFLKLYMGRH